MLSLNREFYGSLLVLSATKNDSVCEIAQSKVKQTGIALREITSALREPGSGDFPAVTPAEAGTRFSDPGGMQG